MDSQFSLSIELSKVVPLVPIVNVASKSLLDLVRSFKKSGSDIVTEHDLASILGRARIDAAFSRTFRNAVRTSTVHKLAGVAELVLEAGAGPTVRNAVDKAPFFSMVVQLSALLWAYEIKSLTQILSHAFAEQHVKDLEQLPSYSDILGTLRCIREQTCGFPWEPKYEAVEYTLLSDLKLSPSFDMRILPDYVFSTLIDALPAVQRWPEEHFVDIKLISGLSTVIIWAHDLLGLTVDVKCNDESRKFGNGKPNIFIDCSWSSELGPVTPRIAVLNKAKDVTFEPSVPDLSWQARLWPSGRYPLHGFGIKIFSSLSEAHVRELRNIEDFVNIITSAAFRYGVNTAAETSQSTRSLMTCVPSWTDILEAARLLFPGLTLQAEPRLLERDNLILRDAVSHYLLRILYGLSMVTNLEDCREVPLPLEHSPEPTFSSTYANAFQTLSGALLGHYDTQIHEAAVVSSWGWSVVLHSVASTDPKSFSQKIAIIKGVPSRNGERKAFVIDSGYGAVTDSELATKHPYEIVGREGDIVRIESFPKGTTSNRYLIGVTDQAFLVQRTARFHKSNVRNTLEDLDLLLGLRGTQEIYWASSRLPSCSCLNRFPPGHSCTLPSKTWLFRGFPKSLRPRYRDPTGADEDPWELRTNPPTLPHGLYAKMARVGMSPEQTQAQEDQGIEESLPSRDQECRVHVSSTAGDPLLRLMMLADLYTYKPSAKEPRFKAWYLRGDNTCVECGIKWLKENVKGNDKEYAHVVLIT